MLPGGGARLAPRPAAPQLGDARGGRHRVLLRGGPSRLAEATKRFLLFPDPERKETGGGKAI